MSKKRKSPVPSIERVNELVALLRDDDIGLMRKDLAELSRAHELAIPLILPILKHEDYFIRVRAVQALGKAIFASFRSKHPADWAIPFVCEALKDPEPRVRLEAVRVAGNNFGGRSAEHAIPLLIGLLWDQNEYLFRHVAPALSKFGGKVPEPFRTLVGRWAGGKSTEETIRNLLELNHGDLQLAINSLLSLCTRLSYMGFSIGNLIEEFGDKAIPVLAEAAKKPELREFIQERLRWVSIKGKSGLGVREGLVSSPSDSDREKQRMAFPKRALGAQDRGTAKKETARQMLPAGRAILPS